MKKEAIQLVRKIFMGMKMEIMHGDLEEMFNAAIVQAKFFCTMLTEENPDKKEKYEMLEAEIGKLTYEITLK